MVQLQLVTATVKLFLKKPSARPQQMIQLVLTYATQVGVLPAFHDDPFLDSTNERPFEGLKDVQFTLIFQ